MEKITRRQFIGTAMAAAGAIIKPELARGTTANSAVRMGLLGCGNRGKGVASSFVNNTNTRIVAIGDLFQDQLDKAKKEFDDLAAQKGLAGPNLMFKGPNAFQEMAASKDIDMIQISTPDYFHPQHLEAAIAGGKHVYCEKPVGVDVEGCKKIIEIGKKADGKVSLEVGFQIRSAPDYVEWVNRIHNGAIGKIACGSVYYHAPTINYPDRGKCSPLEKRIRNFYWDKVLSGDIIVDQNIHVIDICNWLTNAHPIKAVGTGGRKVRNDPGIDIWDHFAVVFTYPENVHVTFNSVQFGESNFWDVGERIFGTNGVAEAHYSGIMRISGKENWDISRTAEGEKSFSTSGFFDAHLHDADAEKDKAFIESIVSGKYHNQAATGAESALSAILGRMAAYSGKEVTWDEMMASNQSYQGEIDLSKL